MGAESSKERNEREKLEQHIYANHYNMQRTQPQQPTAQPATPTGRVSSRNENVPVINVTRTRPLYPNIQNELTSNSASPTIKKNNQTVGDKISTANKYLSSNDASTSKSTMVFSPAQTTRPSTSGYAAARQPTVIENQTYIAGQQSLAQASTSTASTPSPLGQIRLTPTAPPASEVLQMQQNKVFPKKKQIKEAWQKKEKSKQISDSHGSRAAAQKPAIRSRSNTPTPKRNDNAIVKCSTCKGYFGLEIYQCRQGHSSCHRCLGNKLCGMCCNPIENKRNFALEELVNKIKYPCENRGCILKLRMPELDSHSKECPFGDMFCPVNNVTGICTWKGQLSKMISHIKESHRDIGSVDVNQELFLPSIDFDHNQVNIVELGTFRFLVHVQVSCSSQRVKVCVQLVGSRASAARWAWQLHVYNKREPRRKLTHADACHHAATPLHDNDDKCAVIALPLAISYINEDQITYKIFITNNSTAGAGDQCGGGARRKQPLETQNRG